MLEASWLIRVILFSSARAFAGPAQTFQPVSTSVNNWRANPSLAYLETGQAPPVLMFAQRHTFLPRKSSLNTTDARWNISHPIKAGLLDQDLELIEPLEDNPSEEKPM